MQPYLVAQTDAAKCQHKEKLNCLCICQQNVLLDQFWISFLSFEEQAKEGFYQCLGDAMPPRKRRSRNGARDNHRT
jgi:hypothetical protein